MPHGRVCARCASKGDLKRCGLCKGLWYCSIACQRAHWPDHKAFCTGYVVPEDALALLRSRPSACNKWPPSHVLSAAERTFAITELLLVVLCLLSARDLLRAQRVCRSWYLTIALEHKLQQRLFFAHGPGELIMPASTGERETIFLHLIAYSIPTGEKIHAAIQPRTQKQRQLLGYMDRWANDSAYLTTLDGQPTHLTAREVEQTGVHVVLNPFFTMLWRQGTSNMTLSPYLRASAKYEAASWRRMQLTSPPTRSMNMKLQ